MVRLIMGDKGSGKTKKLIAATEQKIILEGLRELRDKH